MPAKFRSRLRPWAVSPSGQSATAQLRVRRAPRERLAVEHCIESDLDAGRILNETELLAIERLLGDTLDDLLR